MAGALFKLMFLLFTSCILGAPLNLCPQKTDDVNTVGLCNTSTGSVDIWDCTSCPPGLGLSVKCGYVYPLGTKIECVLCERGRTYSDKNDIRQCNPCRQCQENENVHGKCEEGQDTISCTCKKGYYRDILTRDCMPCSWCCGDKTNEHVPECNIPQVPPGKQCSLQTVKSCSPTTPPPPPLPPPTTTPIPFITSTTSPTPAPTTIHSKAIGSLNKSTSINVITDSNTPKDPKKSGEEPTSGVEAQGLDIIQLVLVISLPIGVAVLVIIVILGIRCYWKRNGSSSDGNSTGSRSRTSTSISSDGNNSAPLLLELQKFGEPGQSGSCKTDNIKIDLTSNGTGAQAPLLMASEIQGSVEDSVPGTSGADRLGTSSMTCICNNKQSCIQSDVDCFSKEQKLNMLVTGIPFEIQSKVCARLDPEDPFFHDYRMVAEKLGVSKEQTQVIQKNPTNFLLMKHKPKISRLLDILKEIGREDVMEIIETWLDQC